MDRSTLFNNAGVRMMADGRNKIAMELFRGALESKLACERALRSSDANGSNPSQSDPSDSLGCLFPHHGSGGAADCVLVAEKHIETYGLEDLEGLLAVENRPLGVIPALSQLRMEPITLPEGGRGYDPFVYLTPFEIKDYHLLSTQLTSAIIVFNLGVIHHAGSRRSAKPAAFYEIAAALLANEVVTTDCLLIRLALLNNFGAWCFENGEGEALRTCVEHLSAIMDDVVGSTIPLPEEVCRGVFSNIRWFLLPPNGGSPAA